MIRRNNGLNSASKALVAELPKTIWDSLQEPVTRSHAKT